MIKNSTRLTVYRLLVNELNQANIAREEARKADDSSSVDFWSRHIEWLRDALSDFTVAFDDDVFKLYKQAEDVKQQLECCMDATGAKITITVARDSGTTVTAELYDHAALVQGLWDALDYFQSEL